MVGVEPTMPLGRWVTATLMSTHHISEFWRAWRDYSARPCASPLRGGLWPFKIAPDNFVEPVRSRVISTKRLAEAITADSKINFIKIIYSDLQVGRYSNWDVSR